ncbi:MAG: LysR family transcriptional regulator [Pseudomonadota bacterium]
MDKWNEFRTAYHVAKYGTVSGAAERLGVHRATIIRHIDSLEKELGGKIFFRNAKGYSLTEIGEDLLRVAEATEDNFNQFIGRATSRNPGISGGLVVSTVDVAAQVLAPGFHHFVANNPDSDLCCSVTADIVRLEYGEAHIAIRAGEKPDDPDYVVIPIKPLDSALYASKSYIRTHGMPESVIALVDHDFVGLTRGRSAGPYAWLNRRVKNARYRFESDSFHCRLQALQAGVGLTFLPVELGQQLTGIVEVLPPNRAWRAKLWLVTHGATHRTAKVQSFIHSLRVSGFLANRR